jgi:LemA protein
LETAVGIGLLVVLVVALLAVAGMYNGLVKSRNQCDEAWSNVDTELRRRYDLVPNLVNTVKGYAAHERELLEQIVRLREACVAATGTPERQAEPERELVRALGQLMVRLENYPDLKASENFLQLQRELANTEDRVQAARRFYNGNVREYNTRLQSFPTNALASLFTFDPRELFEVESVEMRQPPQVQF